MGSVAGSSSWFPTGIVLLPGRPAAGVPQQRGPVDRQDERRSSDPPSRWTVVDAGGVQVGAWPTHRQAMAELGRIALRGAALPLLVHGPDGRPTGDRLG